MLALLLVAFGSPPVAGVVIVALVAGVMLAGTFWPPADVFQQLTWRILEPAGLQRRQDVSEDIDGRRIARLLGGAGLLLSAVLLLVSATVGAFAVNAAAWLVALPVYLLVALDSGVNFCVVCFVLALARRRAG